MSADQQPPDHVGKYLAAIQAEPRTAAELAELVQAPLNQVLWELRMLERYGKLRPRTDSRGVQYWMPRGGSLQ
jgi:predicted transcriptional regulator